MHVIGVRAGSNCVNIISKVLYFDLGFTNFLKNVFQLILQPSKMLSVNLHSKYVENKLERLKIHDAI